MLYLHGVLGWLIFIPVPIANGIFRESVLVPRLGAAAAHVVSTLMLSMALALGIGLFMYVAADEETTAALLALGALWVALTVGFEFGFGHFVARKPWAVLVRDYNLAAGRIWSLVLLVELLAPPVIG